MNIIEAIDDPVLFNHAFDGSSWRSWRAFLKTLFGLPLAKAEFALFQECTGRSVQRGQPYREAALVIGRRGGKSRVLALIATYLGTLIDWRPQLAAGEQATIAIIASDRHQARVILRYIKGFLRGVPILEDLVENELVETIQLANSCVIEIHTAKISSPRGRTFAAVLCDEIAFWRNDDSTNPDKEVLVGIRPGLATLPGSMLLMASSPYARKGVLWETYRQHFGKDDSRVLVWRAPTLTMNPALDPRIVREAYEDDPASAAAEYGAEFRTDVESYIPRETINACTAAGIFERLPDEHRRYSAFVDPSGGSSDSFTIAIAHRDNDIGVLDVIRERKPPFSPEAVVQEYSELLQRYDIYEVTGDRYGGDWPCERFREHGINYLPSERSKSELYGEFLPLANARRIELLDHTRLAIQLSSLERRTARGGRDSIDHIRGGHDDVANAAAGVLVKVAGPRDQLEVWARLAG